MDGYVEREIERERERDCGGGGVEERGGCKDSSFHPFF